MTVYSSLSPTAAALYTALNVAGLTGLAPGGVYDDVPQAPTWPFVVVDVDEQFIGGFGTRPGTNGFWEVPFRVHVYSQYQGWKEAQGILVKVVELLEAGVSITGFSCWAVFNDEAMRLPDQIVAGVKCKELALNGRIFAEAA